MSQFKSVGGAKPKWYLRIQFRLFTLILGVFLLFCAAFTHYLFSIWENYWISQRQSEAMRYCNYVTTEITVKEQEKSNVSSFLRGELSSVNRMYGYIRLLILNEKGMVTMDSSESRVGRYIINDEVLMAMSGKNSTGSDSEAYRIAMPIYAGDGETINGVLYALVNTSSLRQSISAGENLIIILEVGLGLAAVLLFFAISYGITSPLNKIIRWIRQFKTGDAEETMPEFPLNDEYSLIVDSVEDATRDLTRLDRSRKEFVSNVSHELKTPLSSVKVLSESLLLQESVPEEVYKEFLTDINTEVDRMNNLVTDLLTLVRLEEGENVLTITKFALNDLVADILTRLTPMAKERDITLEEIDDSVVEIEADETKLTIAISNLILNAIKYNRDHGSVTVHIGKEDILARIDVSDTGIGIEQQHFSKLFERFYRVDKARDREQGGTGLGLSIVKQIINLHHGTIDVDSTINVGTTFTVRLPLDQLQDAEDEA